MVVGSGAWIEIIEGVKAVLPDWINVDGMGVGKLFCSG
jgi:hypothetical protein